MGEYYFVVCLTCKVAKWWEHDHIHPFLEGHEGHMFTIMTSDTLEVWEDFRKWFLTFMDWPVKEED